MSAADASNVVIDSPDQVNAFLVAALLAPGGFVHDDGAVDLDRLRAAVTERLDHPDAALRRLRQRVVWSGRRPVWQDCAYDPQWHVRTTAPVAGLDGLAQLVGRLMTTPMPLDRPLWEVLVVPGANPDQPAPGLVVRLHHALADGIAGIHLLQHLLDPGGGPITPQPAAPPQPGAPPRGRTPPRVRTLLTSVARVTAVLRTTVAPTALLGPLGRRRAIAFTHVDLAPLAAGARQAGATLNDALLAGVAAALESVLIAAGEALPDVLPASVPVALPDRGTSGNAVGVMLVPLPLRPADPRVRLARIAAATRTAKGEARAQGTFELTRTRTTARLFAWLARRQRFVAVFVTNVRGPDRPLRLAGAPLQAVWPVAPLQGNVRFGVAALSYAGRLAVTLHTDARHPAPGASAALAQVLQQLSAAEGRDA